MSPGLLMQPMADYKNETNPLAKTLGDSPHDFLAPSAHLHSAALALAKRYLDPLAGSTSQVQEHRLDLTRRKRKRGRHDDGEAERSALKLKEVYLDGFSVDGVWGQARRILDASRGEVERFLTEQETVTEKPLKTVHFDDAGFEVDSDDDEDVEANAGEYKEQKALDSLDEDDFGDEEDLDMEDDEDEVARRDEVGIDAALEDMEDLEDDSGQEDFDDGPFTTERPGVFVKDKHGLNDGFFDIDEFNKDSEFLEQADARGDDDGAASDEEDVDWAVNPMDSQGSLPNDKTYTSKSKKGGRPAMSDDDEEGPTFGDADLDAPWSDDDEEMPDEDMDEEDEGLYNTNEIRYEDFFEPPPRALTKTRRARALPKTQPDAEPSRPAAEDVQRAIDSHRRDLFDDDFSEVDEDQNEEVDEDASGARNLSTHERRRVALAKQIRELEAAAVSKREWQMSGEATAHVRPENALLEEDLDFERAGKPVPVITADVSASIEDMIKQRILNRQFDEVITRRPGTEGQPQARRGLIELSDQKDPVSLAESYEQAYLAQNDPNAKDTRTEAEKAAHAEIQQLWSKIAHDLDSLCSLHFKPKPANIEVKTISDAPKILMEEARPSGVEGINGEEGGLAPQEVFRVGDDKEAGEEGVAVTKGGGVIAKEELTKEQRLRRRRREKERAKKREASEAAAKVQASSNKAKADAVPAKKSKRDDEAEVLKTLKAGGVKVIGKGGQLQDLDGQKVKKTA